MAFWYIYGAGGYGVETMDLLRQMLNAKSEDNVRPVFLADTPTTTNLPGYDVVPFPEAVPRSPVTIAVGEPETRCLLREKALNAALNEQTCRCLLNEKNSSAWGRNPAMLLDQIVVGDRHGLGVYASVYVAWARFWLCPSVSHPLARSEGNERAFASTTVHQRS